MIIILYLPSQFVNIPYLLIVINCLQFYQTKYSFIFILPSYMNVYATVYMCTMYECVPHYMKLLILVSKNTPSHAENIRAFLRRMITLANKINRRYYH